MIKGLVVIVLVGTLSFFFTDIKSPSRFFSAVLPLVTFLSLFALALWFVALLYRRRTGGTGNDGSDTTGIGGFDGGGDGDG